jgi:integrase
VHQRAADWKDIPAIYKELGRSVADQALRFYILTVPRVANVTAAVWGEMDLKEGVWSLPAERMKSDKPFRVPLTWQAKEILHTMKPKTDKTAFVFPSASAHKKGVVSENTWNNAFKARKRDTTAHGIRSSFSDWCVDNKICDEKLAEFCLDHQTRTKVGKAYLRSDRLEERREVLSRWAEFVTEKTLEDYADVLEAKSFVARHREVPNMGEEESQKWARFDGLENEN